MDLLADFKLWLGVLGYSEKSILAYESHTEELLSYTSDQVDSARIQGFIDYIQNRPNQRRSGGLSSSTLVMKLRVLKLFLSYLALLHKEYIEVVFPEIEVEENSRLPLSRGQIKKLYEVIDRGDQVLRDRALMVVYYGCGLRRSEGQGLVLKDVLWGRKLLYVRKGKWGKSRYVPLTKTQLEDLKGYMHDARPLGKSSNLLLSRLGKPWSGSGMVKRLHHWGDLAGIKQPLSLHVLRHSIATHLLENGMSLIYVSRFLGHSSLVATQRYTHLLDRI